MTDNYKAFIRNYWNYYRELEDELLQTKRYVEFTEKNFKTFSIEYLKLYQAVCSEIDVLGKALASEENKDFKPDDKKNNIFKWWYEIQHLTITVEEDEVEKNIRLDEFECVFMGDYTIVPWKDFWIRKGSDSNGRIRYNLASGRSTPTWWTSYNKVKHNRTLVPKDSVEINYTRANLGNLINAFSALFVLELLKMQKSGDENDQEAFADYSKLFVRITNITSEDIDKICKG